MRTLRAALVLILSYALGVQPSVAAMQTVVLSVPSVAGSQSAAGAAASATRVRLNSTVSLGALQTRRLESFSPIRSANLGAAFVAPTTRDSEAAWTVARTPGVSVAAAPVQAASVRTVPVAAADAVGATPGGAVSVPERVARIRANADLAVADLGRATAGEAREKADAQFAALLGERRLAAASIADEGPGQRVLSAAGGNSSRLEAPTPVEPGAKSEPPAPKLGLFQVFHDKARNGAFWRYVSGYAIFLAGFEMYVVGLPYLISSMTTNSLKEHKDARVGNDEAVKELIRSNRSLSRIAHWAAQGLSYVTIPLFTRNEGQDGPKKWLVRSMLIRAVVLAAVPGLFFATGFISLTAAMWILFGLIALQSFFQGISVTAEGKATTRLLGDPSVTAEERTKANSVLTVLAAIIAIIGPLVAGQIATIGPVMGKSGVGGAVIYGIYAAAIAATAFIYATIKIFGGQSEAAKLAAARGEAPKETAPKSLKGVLAELWVSIKDGVRIVFKDRLLRTMLLLSMVGSLFSDPLIFNVLPEYIEGLVAHNPGSVSAIMGIPGLGWFLKTLTATPMGNFALMMVMASVGSIVATFLMKPVTKLFTKLGFKTEEALTIPFYVLAALEAPLFILMIHTPTMLGAVLLYGLQSLVVGFIGLHITGLYQKNLGRQKEGDINKILAADSLLGIAAAIVSTFAYGFLLKNIPIQTSLIIAAVATGVVALIRLASPFLMFTKDQRRPPAPPAPPSGGSVPPAHAMPSSGEHNGPNSILSTHL